MIKESLANRRPRRLIRSLLTLVFIAALALVGIGMAQAQDRDSAMASATQLSEPRPGTGLQAQASPPGTPANLRTVYTGDVINGKRVVSALNTDDLEPGKKHLLYFQGVQMATGQPWYVSVMVAKGARPGKRITLTSGVHGDEMSSVHTVQKVMAQLNPAEMSGTVMAVMDIARPAMESMQRNWPGSGRGFTLTDMNRVWPGNENGPDAVGRQAGLVFHRLLQPNSDLAIDFHTGATGFDAAAFHIGDMGIPDVRTMMMLYPVPAIFDNPLYPGMLHNAYTSVGIPCFTIEVGGARRLDPSIIPLFIEGTMNVLKHYGVIPGAIGRTAEDVDVYIGRTSAPVLLTHGGFIETLVSLDDNVNPGQKVAIQRDAFGDVLTEYTSPVQGRVAALRSDATSEPGNVLMFILTDRVTSSGEPAYVE